LLTEIRKESKHSYQSLENLDLKHVGAASALRFTLAPVLELGPGGA
jgi:hypothetical protein